MAKFDDKKQLKCSFCGKNQDQVKRLIAGPGVYICDECIDLCSEIIQDEFLSIDEILNQVITDEDKDKIAEYIQIKIKSILNEKMSFAPSSIKNLIQSYVSDMIEEEIKNSIDDLSSEMINKASKRINIQQMIEDKINELDLYELEEIILKVAKNELKHIEILGFVLGFAIGIVQGIIIVIL